MASSNTMYIAIVLPTFTEFVTKEMRKRFSNARNVIVLDAYLDHHIGDRVVVHVTYEENDHIEILPA